MHNDKPIKLYNIIVFNCFLVAISLLYTQTYIPCMPAIANHLTKSHSVVQLVLASNIFCFGISQLFYGPLSDRYGRQKVLMLGLWVTFVGNLFSACSTNNIMLISGQIVAGLGAGACSVIPRAISKDLLTKSDLVKAISYMSMASTIATGTAPVLGSILQDWWGWRSVFLFLTLLTLMAISLCAFFMPETCKEKRELSARQIMKSYGNLFLNRWFLIYSGLNACAYSSIIIYLIFTPFLFQSVFLYSANQNGLIYFLCAGSYFLGNLILNQLTDKFSVKKILFLGIISITMGSLLMIVAGFMQNIAAIELVICGLVIHFGSGLLTPVTYKEILNLTEVTASISSAAINVIRVLIALVFSLFAITASISSSTTLAYLLGLLTVGCVGAYVLIIKSNTCEIQEDLI